MTKIRAVFVFIILSGISFAGAESAATSETYWDWLGVGPIYSYGDLISPYYLYHYPAYSHAPASYSTRPVYSDPYWYNPWTYGKPYYYYQPYFAWKYPANAWWIGTHGNLPKTIAIARSGSSMRVYSNGLWQTP